MLPPLRRPRITQPIPRDIPLRPPSQIYPQVIFCGEGFLPVLDVDLAYLPFLTLCCYWDKEVDAKLNAWLHDRRIGALWLQNGIHAEPFVADAGVIQYGIVASVNSAMLAVALFQVFPPAPEDPAVPDNDVDLLKALILSDGDQLTMSTTARIDEPVLTEEMLQKAWQVLNQADQQHRPYPGGFDFTTGGLILYCYQCGEPWPCSAAKETP